MNFTLHRVRATFATAVIGAGLALAPSAAYAVPTPEASAAGQWLADQVPSDTHLFTSVYGEGESDNFVDYGLNLDLQYALEILGDSTTADQVYDAVLADATSYTDAFGTRYAGAVGKLATYVGLHGDDPTDVDGRDLISELAELMTNGGAEEGRLKDSPDGESQSANTVGQAWGVRALASAGSDDADIAAGFLVDQQCDDGGFRLVKIDEGCSSSVDATALAVIALDEQGGHADAVKSAQKYLAAEQATDGSLSDEGVANSNSTGLAATVFSRFDDVSAATAGADWIAAQQATASTPGLTDEAGAIAFDPDAFAAGASDGIDDIERDQWVRATAQAAVALDVASEADVQSETGFAVQTWQVVVALVVLVLALVAALVRSRGRR